MNNFIKICLALGVIILIVMFLNSREEKMNQAAESYEQCVKVQYDGMTPSYYYNQTGHYPTCNK